MKSLMIVERIVKLADGRVFESDILGYQRLECSDKESIVVRWLAWYAGLRQLTSDIIH